MNHDGDSRLLAGSYLTAQQVSDLQLSRGPRLRLPKLTMLVSAVSPAGTPRS
jgi:hypothetical protein